MAGVLIKGFFVRWRDGVLRATPLQLLVVRRWGVRGEVLGMLLAIVVIAYQGLWYWLLFLVCVLVVLIVDLVSVEQQVRKLEDFVKG